MGLQSSRIIWGKTKLPGTNPLTPITVYDDSDTVYISGNYAIYSASSSSVSPDYRLYLCGAAETGGEFEPDDWKEQKGVKNWDLEGHRAYNVNARVIKELHDVEYTYTDEEGHEQTITLDGVYLFKCITKTPPDHAWHQECWKLVFQEVGLAYIARDHKEVYYNGKFHKAMYFMPPEAQDEEDFEVIDFNEEWRYHFGDLMIYNKYNTEKGNKCYKYVNHIPSAGTYVDAKWEVQNNPDDQPITEYEANIAYPKNYKCIKRQIIIYEQVICEYDGYHLKYSTGKYCVYKIDKDDYLQWEIDAGERLYPNWYRDKIINGEEIYGLFRAKRATGNGNAFNQNDWDLVNYRDGHYILQWIPVNNGDPYNVGDERIYFFCDTDGNPSSIMGLSRCIKAHITPTTANCPTNSEYWETVDQNIDSIDAYRLYRANRDISAADNTHFIAKNFSVVTQTMKMDEELYGIIWKKIGVPNAGGAPYGYFFTTYGSELYYTGTNDTEQEGYFAYFVVTATRAKFNTTTGYRITSTYSDTYRRLTNGTGFSETVVRNNMAYGIPRYGRAIRASHQYIRFVYVKITDGWVKADLGEYILADNYDMHKDFPMLYRFSFTIIGSGFISLGDSASDFRRLYKFIVDPSGNYLGKNEIQLPQNIQQAFFNDDIYAFWFEHDHIFTSVNERTNNLYIEPNGYYNLSWGREYYYRETGIIDSNGYTTKSSENSYSDKKIFTGGRIGPLADDIYSRAYKITEGAQYSNTHVAPELRSITLAEFYSAASFMGLFVRTEHEEGLPTYYYIDDIPKGSAISFNSDETRYIGGMSSGVNYIFHWASYNYLQSNDPSSENLKIRTFCYLETIHDVGPIITDILLQNTYNCSGSSVSDTFPVTIIPLGRVSNTFYFVAEQPYGTPVSQFLNKTVSFDNYADYHALYGVNLTEKTITKLSDNGFTSILLRYINNEYVIIDGHKIVKMRCKFDEINNAHEPARDDVLFEDLGNDEYALIVGVSINDKNIFSNTTEVPVNTFTGSMFLRMQISHNFDDFGVYAYIPMFDLTNKSIMEATGFFWMSSGEKTDDASGYFYGGRGDSDSRSFDFPLVF